MAATRVVVVDDAVIVRRLVGQALGAEGDFELAGTASDGDVALEVIAGGLPDIVTLDIDMPMVDGIETLRRIRARWPHLPVVMFTGMLEPGPAELEALALGASQLIPKLPHEGNMVNAIQWVRQRLAPVLRDVVAKTRVATMAPPPARPAIPPRPVSRVANPVELLAVAASTGGPNALEACLAGLPREFALPVVITQHMPVGFTGLLADRLRQATGRSVEEAQAGAVLRPGTVWIAPGDHHLVVQRVGVNVVLQVNREAPENSCRPSADVMFRSVARVYGPRALAVVLTGMGQDGMEGARAMVEAGGRVLIQDEATSVVWGMPGAVARAGLAEAVLPLAELPAAILQRCGRPAPPALAR